MSSTVAPVIAGVDGSPSSLAAAAIAARAAIARSAPLELIHGYLHALGYGAMPVDPYAVGVPAPPVDGQRMLDDLAGDLCATHPDLLVRTRQMAGGPAATLVDESHRADLLVVGCRGLGGFAGLVLGSVSAQVAAHAHCPVLVVRPAEPASAPAEPAPESAPAESESAPAAAPEPEPAESAPAAGPGSTGDFLPASGPVLVGVDFSEAGELALEYAADEAVRLGVPLVLAHVWWNDPLDTLAHANEDVVGRARRAAAGPLAEAVARVRRRHPALACEQRLIHSMNPEHSLIEASREAAVVAIGSRGRGGFGGLLLGSVSQSLVHHAHCPVLVVHPHSHRGQQRHL